LLNDASALSLPMKYDYFSKHFYLEGDKLFRANGKEVEAMPDKRGYCRVKCGGKNYLLHRLVFCLHNKVDVPTHLSVDHIDRNPSNNAPENLRLLSNEENSLNKNDVEFKKGSVIKQDGRFQARFTFKRKKEHFGVYATQQEALEILEKVQAVWQEHDSIDALREAVGVEVKELGNGCVYKQGKSWAFQLYVDGVRVKITHKDKSVCEAIQEYHKTLDLPASEIEAHLRSHFNLPKRDDSERGNGSVSKGGVYGLRVGGKRIYVCCSTVELAERLKEFYASNKDSLPSDYEGLRTALKQELSSLKLG